MDIGSLQCIRDSLYHNPETHTGMQRNYQIVLKNVALQVEDSMGKRTLRWSVLPDVPVVIGMLIKDAFENLVHFIITSESIDD